MTETCSHQFCGKAIVKGFASYKWSDAHQARVPFHAACSHAHPAHDVSQGTGSPFTTITRKAV